MTSPSLTVRTITPEEHLDFIRKQRSASFLQTPAWAAVKSEWQSESLGWFEPSTGSGAAAELVGVALVLYRQLPKVKRYLAYIPEGPVIDWDNGDLDRWLAPMTLHLAKKGAFGVRMGPPVITRRWAAEDVKKGVADESIARLGEIAPRDRSQSGARVVSQLRELGWRLQAVEGGFAAGQPQYNFQIPLTGRTEDEVLKGMNQLWRRNIKKAAKAGVEVTRRRGRPRPGPPRVPRAVQAHSGARPLHAASAVVLPDHVPRAARRGVRPDPALPRPPRGRPGRRDHLGPGGRPHLVLLRRRPRPRSATSAAPTPHSGR